MGLSLHNAWMTSAMQVACGSEEWEAWHRGNAYGHAFRAAELAYDLGQRHAIERASRQASERPDATT